MTRCNISFYKQAIYLELDVYLGPTQCVEVAVNTLGLKRCLEKTDN